AQTPEKPLTQPCGKVGGGTLESRMVERVRPRLSSSVFAAAPARQAGGHWFEPSTAHSLDANVTTNCLKRGRWLLSIRTESLAVLSGEVISRVPGDGA